MSRMEGYKYTSLEQRMKTPFAGTIKVPERMVQLPLPEPVERFNEKTLPTEQVVFPLETAQPAPQIKSKS